MVERSTAFLHPVMRPRAEKLVGQLYEAFHDRAVTVLFRPFETYRSPQRQAKLYEQGRTMPGKIVTKAQQWQSAHEYGLAIDLVPYQRLNSAGGLSGFAWSWDAPKSDWDFMHKLARSMGFNDRIPWDSPHVEDPTYTDFKTITNWVLNGDVRPSEVPFP